MTQFTITRKDIWGLSTLIATEYIIEFPSYGVSFNVCDEILDTDKTFIKKIKTFYRDFHRNEAKETENGSWTFISKKETPTESDLENFIISLALRIEAKHMLNYENFVDVGGTWLQIRPDVFGKNYIFRDDGNFWPMTSYEEEIYVSYI